MMKFKPLLAFVLALTLLCPLGYLTPAYAFNETEWRELCVSGSVDEIRAALGELSSRDFTAGVNSPLHIAAEYASDPAVIRLMTDGETLFHIEDTGLEGLTPLMLASAYNPNAEIIEALIRAGALTDVNDGSGRTPLHLAAAMNDSPSVVACLLRGGASASKKDNEGRTPLWSAAARSNAQAVELLLDAGAPVDEPDNAGVTPLQMACLSPDAATIRLLIEAGADANRRDAQRYTVVMRAVAAGADSDTLKALITGKADLLAEDDQNRSAFFLSVSNPEVSNDVRAILLEAEGTPDTREGGLMTPLMEACRANDITAVRFLLENGADPSLSDKNEWTPLMFAAMSNASSELMKIMVEHGASPDLGTRDGITPLMLASRSPSQFDGMSSILEAGASVNLQNLQGVTALMIASAAGNDRAVEKLLSFGADVSLSDIDGMTALFHAVLYGDDNSRILERLIAAGAEVDARTPNHGSTPLMNASLRGAAWAASKLLDAGADVTAKDFIGWTPLHFAARANGNNGEASCLGLLIEKIKSVGAEVDARDNGGTTPLMVAAAADNAAAVKALLEAGAKPALTDRTGRDALGYARLRNAKNCVALLEVL